MRTTTTVASSGVAASVFRMVEASAPGGVVEENFAHLGASFWLTPSLSSSRVSPGEGESDGFPPGGYPQPRGRSGNSNGGTALPPQQNAGLRPPFV